MTGDPLGGEHLTLDAASSRSGTSPVYAAAAVSWLGLLVHNVADLPDQTLLSPETLWPSLVLISLLASYAAGLRRSAGIGLAIWALLNLLGGAVSVLPLPLLPFTAEQTLRHYSFHLLYAATQIPLLVVSWQRATAGTRGGTVLRRWSASRDG